MMAEARKLVIETLGDLPPTPAVAIKAIQVMQKQTSSASALADVISLDPAVSARVLKAANSPLFYTGSAVSTLNHAIVILGEANLRNLVLEASLRGVSRHFGVLERMLWENSIGCAIASRLVAEKTPGIDKEEAFLAGLFCNIGKMAMNNANRQLYKELVAVASQQGLSLSDLEQEYFGCTHAEAGSAILAHWNLPESLVMATLHHHDVEPGRATSFEIVQLTAVVNVAGGLCRHLSIGQNSGRCRVDLADLPGARQLQLTDEQLTVCCTEFLDRFKQERALFLI